MKTKKCGECALQKINGVCPIFRQEMPEDENGCPLFTSEIITCDVCGGHIMSGAIFDFDGEGKAHILCQQCEDAPLCSTCENRYCAFKQDRDCRIPPYIMKQIHPQPNMTIQQQVINPDRIAATCANGCPCYYEAGLKDSAHCIKQSPNGGCDKYKTLWRS